MTARRAFYMEGNGLLAVSVDRMCFLTTADHPAARILLEAARSDRPIRSLAIAIVNAEFDLPPFTFIQTTRDLEGMVFGSLEVEVCDTDSSVIDGSSPDPWAQVHSSATATVTCGGQVGDTLWVESGIVRAGAFRWLPVTPESTHQPGQTVNAVRDEPSPPLQTQHVELPPPSEGAPPSAPAVTPPPPRSRTEEVPQPEYVDRAPTSPSEIPSEDILEPAEPAPADSAEASLAELLEVEHDLTIDAIRLAAIRSEIGNNRSLPTSRPSRPPALTEAPTPDTSEEPIPHDVSRTAASADGIDPDATVEVPPGQVFLGEHQLSQQHTVEALMCLECLHPNAPMTALCRKCKELLSEENSEPQSVPQPALGAIHLSGDRVETLDADLVIGRNPARKPLAPHQRAVVHGEGDRSVSRRHIELKLDGWDVIAVNLKEGWGTTVESRRGGHVPLLPGEPHKLESGDTVQYGGAWFRYVDE